MYVLTHIIFWSYINNHWSYFGCIWNSSIIQKDLTAYIFTHRGKQNTAGAKRRTCFWVGRGSCKYPAEEISKAGWELSYFISRDNHLFSPVSDERVTTLLREIFPLTIILNLRATFNTLRLSFNWPKIEFISLISTLEILILLLFFGFQLLFTYFQYHIIRWVQEKEREAM